jgi:sterol O-acyltransferase
MQIVSATRKAIRADARRRRMFPTIDYTSRVSHLDPDSDYHDFRGFFVLFWIGLAIMAFSTIFRNMKETGYPFRVQIWHLFTVKTWELALADALMVLTTGVSVPLQQLVRKGTGNPVNRWNRAGITVQSLYQAFWFSVWVAVPFHFEWTWTAQVFLVLHTLTLLMKMHSYTFYNGHLSEAERRLKALDQPAEAQKEEVLEKVEKYPGAGHSEAQDEKRLSDDDHDAVSLAESEEKARLEHIREDLAMELVSPLGNVTYPSNLTYTNYADYLLCPTLCYELEYPRTSRIRLSQLTYKLIAVFGVIFLLTITSEEFILPVLQQSAINLASAHGAADTLLVLAESVSQLLFPFMITFLLVFLVIFEYVLGFFAELTRFADRRFYADWWNSTDWLEFSREWNIPVHHFLRRHVYSASAPFIGKSGATLITFLISAVGHEIVMACITKKIRGYGFAAQMSQLPIVMFQRLEWVKRSWALNNASFWCSMILGLSIICSLYVLV